MHVSMVEDHCPTPMKAKADPIWECDNDKPQTDAVLVKVQPAQC